MKLFTLSVLFFVVTDLSAQWVNIPDSAFAGWLNSNYPQCMNGHLMDTTCAAIIHETTVDLSGGDYVTSFDGIQYFDSLQTFNCYGNTLLTSFPNLPSTVTHFDCHASPMLNAFSFLPNGLTYFDVSYCHQNYLPALPNALKILNCEHNSLSALPILPDSLVLLKCNDNQLAVLPSLPNKLRELYCYNNQLTALPNFPNTVFAIEFDHNQIQNLPPLPDSLTGLGCTYNLLTNIPLIPNKVTQLFCNHNLITAIPNLPNTVYQADFSYNQVTSIGQLPHCLNFLDVSYNPVSCLPRFDSIEALYIASTNILCLPDSSVAINITPANLNLPHCDSVDPNQCVHCYSHFVIYPDTSTQSVYYGFNHSTGSNLNYIWNFGDGDTSTQPYPIHHYTQAEHYLICLTVSNNSGCSNTYCDSSFYVFKTEGGLMNELDILNPATNISSIGLADKRFSLFPNPASSLVTITVDKTLIGSAITITEATGRIVFKSEIESQKFEITCTGWASGVYFIQITLNGEHIVKRFIKE